MELKWKTCLRLSSWSLGNPDCFLEVESWVALIQCNPILHATVGLLLPLRIKERRKPHPS